MPLKDYLPNFKESLNAFYDERLKSVLENKSSEYKSLLEKHLNYWQNTQKVLVIILLGILLLLLVAYFWKNKD